MTARARECRLKHEAVIEYLKAHDLDGVVLTRRCNFAWYTAGGLNHVSTSGEVGVASLLITADGALCVTNSIEAPRMAAEELESLDVDTRTVPWHDPAAAARAWDDLLGARRTACDMHAPGLPQRVVPLNTDFDRLRWSLTDHEMARYRALGRDVADALETAARSARPGMTEHALAAAIVGHLHEGGIRAPVVLVAADERVRRFRHPLPTTRRVEHSGMVVCCGERHGLIVSNSRLFSFGPVDDDLRRRHEAVCRVDAAMIAATRPGRTLGQVFDAACAAYAEAGFPDEWHHHHQGGSTGYLPREVRAEPGDPTPILDHQAFAWNPSIAGTKSEDTILVTPDGNEILSDTGQWPRSGYEAHGQTWPRCDILIL